MLRGYLKISKFEKIIDNRADANLFIEQAKTLPKIGYLYQPFQGEKIIKQIMLAVCKTL